MNNLLSLFQGYVEKKSFHLFGTKFEVAYYGVMMALAMITCVIVAIPLMKRRGFKPDLLIDVMLAVIPCSVVCARLWYVVLDIDQFVNFNNFNLKETVESIFRLRDGGLAIQGGVLGGGLGILIVGKIQKIPAAKIADIGATLLPLGQAIGRWGNFFNQEVYGKVTTITRFPISVYIQACGEYHYALFFYEMVLNLLLFGLLMTFFFGYNGKRSCYSMSFYLCGYGLMRALMEPLRDVAFQMGNGASPIPMSTLTSIGFILAGVIIFAVLMYKDVKEGNYWWKYFYKKPPQQDLKINQNSDNE